MKTGTEIRWRNSVHDTLIAEMCVCCADFFVGLGASGEIEAKELHGQFYVCFFTAFRTSLTIQMMAGSVRPTWMIPLKCS